MLCYLFAALALAQTKVSIAPFSTWDGKSWAGIAVGVSEKDLRKQFSTSKTLTADPASIRLNSEDKRIVVTAILTDVNQRGSVAGIDLEGERNEPLWRADDIKQAIGEPGAILFPRLRFSDWSLWVWKEKGIVAVLSNAGVHKILLAPPAVLHNNLDALGASATLVHEAPRIQVGGFEVSASSDPTDTATDLLFRQYLGATAQRSMDSYGGTGWAPNRQSGTRIRIAMRIKKRKDISLDGTISVGASDELGDVSISESVTDTVKTDMEAGFRAALMVEDLMARMNRSIEDKYRQLVWRAEWRPFYALAR